MENNEEEYDVDAVVAEIDAAYAAGKMRRGTPEEAGRIHEAAGKVLDELEDKERKAAIETFLNSDEYKKYVKNHKKLA